jgi:hypothetical protein
VKAGVCHPDPEVAQFARSTTRYSGGARFVSHREVLALLQSAQLRSAVRRVAITAAERREVFGAASFRIVPRLQKPAFGVGAHSRLAP